MKPGFFLAIGCAAVLGGAVGCSSSSDEPATSSAPAASGEATAPAAPPVTAAAPDQAKVTFGPNDAGPVTGIGCATENGVTTITIEGSQATKVVLTDEDTPLVRSVGIGEIGSDAPALAYQDGTGAPATATRDGGKYSVTGTGLGTDAANPMAPVDTPFEITVTCP